jgi:hypothetical protein
MTIEMQLTICQRRGVQLQPRFKIITLFDNTYPSSDGWYIMWNLEETIKKELSTNQPSLGISFLTIYVQLVDWFVAD